MTSAYDTGRDLDPREPGAAIHLGERALAERDATFWGSALVVFMRCLAILWVVQGLFAWGDLLVPARSILETAPRPFVVLSIVFAIIDVVAAVGLWLATPWGGVLWLFAASVQIFSVMALRSLFWGGWLLIDVALMMAYFALTWQAGRLDGQPVSQSPLSRFKQRDR